MVVGLTMIGLVVAPVFHKYVPPPLAVIVALVPEQMVVAVDEMPAVTPVLTVMFTTAVLVHVPFETKTEYDVAVVGETTIGLVVVPVFHEYVPPPVAVSVAFCPVQIVVLAVLIFALGEGFTVTTMAAVSEQLPAETITEYVVPVVGETVMDEVVAPVFQEYVPVPDAVSVVELPEQMVLFPETAAVGGGTMLTVLTAVSVHPFPFVTVTV